MTQVSEVLEWHGRTVVATDGDKLGKVEQIYFDQETNRPEWALVNTGMFAGKSSFMPLQGATSDGEQVTAPYSKDQVKDAPQIEPTARSPSAEEAELYRHYGVEYGESRSGSGLPESPTGANGEQGITEGQGRLKKHLVSERVAGVMPSERDNVVIEPESDRDQRHAQPPPAPPGGMAGPNGRPSIGPGALRSAVRSPPSDATDRRASQRTRDDQFTDACEGWPEHESSSSDAALIPAPGRAPGALHPAAARCPRVESGSRPCCTGYTWIQSFRIALAARKGVTHVGQRGDRLSIHCASASQRGANLTCAPDDVHSSRLGQGGPSLRPARACVRHSQGHALARRPTRQRPAIGTWRAPTRSAVARAQEQAPRYWRGAGPTQIWRVVLLCF